MPGLLIRHVVLRMFAKVRGRIPFLVMRPLILIPQSRYPTNCSLLDEAEPWVVREVVSG